MGPRNHFTTGAASRGQPITFDAGMVADAFTVQFTSFETPTWELDGESATVSSSNPRCSGAELIDVPGATHVAAFASHDLHLEAGVVVESQTDMATVIAGNDLFVDPFGTVVDNAWARDDVIVGPAATVQGRSSRVIPSCLLSS